MTKGDPTERLSARRQFVLVLRLLVEVDGSVQGELVDPVSERRQRFVGLDRLADALRSWVDAALSSTANESRPNDESTDT
jgi:hypothetical protein